MYYNVYVPFLNYMDNDFFFVFIGIDCYWAKSTGPFRHQEIILIRVRIIMLIYEGFDITMYNNLSICVTAVMHILFKNKNQVLNLNYIDFNHLREHSLALVTDRWK